MRGGFGCVGKDAEKRRWPEAGQQALVTTWVSQEGAAAREAGWRGEEERSQEGRRGQRAWKESTSHCAPKRIANPSFGLCVTQQGAMDPLLEQSGSGLLHLRGSSVSCHPDSLRLPPSSWVNGCGAAMGAWKHLRPPWLRQPGGCHHSWDICGVVTWGW